MAASIRRLGTPRCVEDFGVFEKGDPIGRVAACHMLRQQVRANETPLDAEGRQTLATDRR